VVAYLHDDVWQVAWEQGVSTPCDVSDDDVTLWDARADALADADRRVQS
jgi:hypothetical protein